MLKGKLWRVCRDWVIKDDDGNEVHASCDKEERIIWLSKKLKGDKSREYFKHELGHAILFEAHLNEAGGLTELLEEIIVSAFSDFMTHTVDVTWKK